MLAWLLRVAASYVRPFLWHRVRYAGAWYLLNYLVQCALASVVVDHRVVRRGAGIVTTAIVDDYF